jgi:hypothetical protein
MTNHEERMIGAAIRADRAGLCAAASSITMAQAHADIEAVREMDEVPAWIKTMLATIHNLAGSEIYSK